MKEIEITAEPIELYKLLKFENLVTSGGEAKYVIAEGLVRVNGKVETRKHKKIFDGDVLSFGDLNFRVRVKQ
jgi:ribosome-associated protein